MNVPVQQKSNDLEKLTADVYNSGYHMDKLDLLKKDIVSWSEHEAELLHAYKNGLKDREADSDPADKEILNSRKDELGRAIEKESFERHLRAGASLAKYDITGDVAYLNDATKIARQAGILGEESSAFFKNHIVLKAAHASGASQMETGREYIFTTKGKVDVEKFSDPKKAAEAFFRADPHDNPQVVSRVKGVPSSERYDGRVLIDTNPRKQYKALVGAENTAFSKAYTEVLVEKTNEARKEHMLDMKVDNKQITKSNEFER